METSGSEMKGIGPDGHSLQWYHYTGDFVNMLKAFIGTNYQGLAFAFSRSGLVLGFVGVALVASLTDHCIQMLIQCKADIIRKACEKEFATGQFNVRELTKFRKRLEQTIGYADISHRVLGNGFYHLTQFAVWFTQFSTTVAYFVVMGNTISALYPSQAATNQTTANYTTAYTAHWSATTEASNFVNDLIRANSNATTNAPPTSVTTDFTTGGNLTTTDTNSTNVTTTTQAYVSTTIHPHAFELSADLLLIICILIPLPFLIITSLIRRVRLLAPFSTIAAVALAIGATAVLAFILHEFTVTDDYALWKIFTFPLFFAQLTSNFEGIGCLLPIHSSMEGNRHLFSKYLHANVFIVFVVLCTYGSLGYLRYGDDVNQLIIMMIPQESKLSAIVDMTIIISVLFTYPLQSFPVIEIAEGYLFGEGRCCGPRRQPRTAAKTDLAVEESGGVIENGPDERSALLDSQSSVRSIEASVSETAVVISGQVSAWKRNILRIFITLLTAVVAVVTRNSFAYINAFSGAIAASLLSFVIPCLVHVRMHFSDLPWYVIAKDIFIVCLSVVFSVLALILIVLNVIQGNVL